MNCDPIFRTLLGLMVYKKGMSICIITSPPISRREWLYGGCKWCSSVENARALSEETNSKHGVPKLWKNGDGDIPKLRRFLGRETINTGALPLELLPP